MRREAGLSQARLGTRLGVSSSLVGHIEVGTRTPQSDFAARCDEVFDSDDFFVRLCRNISTPAGPRWFLRWSDEIEPRAQVLRSWDPLLIPGLLQTEDYARAVFRGGLATSEREVEDQVRARMARQVILGRDNPPVLWVLMDEWVLRRPIGGRKVMCEQLDHLLATADHQNIKVQLVPHDTQCTVGLMSSFTIAELPDVPTSVIVDSAAQAEASSEHHLVNIVWGIYDMIRAEAYRPSQSLELIKEARGQWQ